MKEINSLYERDEVWEALVGEFKNGFASYLGIIAHYSLPY